MPNANPIESLPDQIPPSSVVVAGATITMQQLQQIYAELTGKAETISKYYDDPIRLTFVDIEQLHHKIVQTWEQYRVVSSSCSFTIYYLKNTKNQFNNFAALSLQTANGIDPVESILIKYDFLVLLPQVPKPQTYSVSVRVVSRLTVEKRMRERGFFAPPPRFIRFMGHHTASIEISYVDYSVARAFFTAIDEWFQGVPRTKRNNFMRWIQQHSHWIPRIGKTTTAIVVTVLAAGVLPHFMNGIETSVLQFGQFFLWAGLTMYLAYMLAGWSGIFAEYAVDRWDELSYIKINRGDDIEIDKNARDNRMCLIKGAIGTAGTLLVDIAAKIVAELTIHFL
jgi:hypothetical protein